MATVGECGTRGDESATALLAATKSCTLDLFKERRRMGKREKQQWTVLMSKGLALGFQLHQVCVLFMRGSQHISAHSCHCTMISEMLMNGV